MAKSSSSKKKHQSPSSSSTMYDERSMMAHEAETIIPGSFVVLQGNPGDGMCDTISTCPELPVNDQLENETDEMQVVQQRQGQQQFVKGQGLLEEAKRPHAQHDSRPALARQGIARHINVVMMRKKATTQHQQHARPNKTARWCHCVHP